MDLQKWLTASRSGAATLLFVIGIPLSASAQIGAIGAVPGVAGSEGLYVGTPIFSESAVVLQAGRMSAGVHFALLNQSFDFVGLSYDRTLSQVMAGVAFAPAPRLMLSLGMSPYISVEETSQFGTFEESGRGDAVLNARVQLWSAPGGRSHLAANGGLRLPVGDTLFGASGAALALSAGLSHQAGQFGLHGGLGVAMPFDEDDGQTAITFSGAGVYGVTPRIWLSLEMLGSTSDGEHVVNLAPGARFGLGRSVFLDAALLVNASTSLPFAPFDTAFVVGLNVAP